MAAVDKYDFLLADTRQSGEDWYLVLTNGIPFVEKPDGTRSKSDGKVVTLKRDLEAKGMRRYVIASVSTVFYADV
jgi:sulfur transfer complex TusBCD TusB component (DsrH family)